MLYEQALNEFASYASIIRAKFKIEENNNKNINTMD